MEKTFELGEKISIDEDSFTVKEIVKDKFVLSSDNIKIKSASLETEGDKIILNISKEVEPKIEEKDIWILGKKYMVINESIEGETKSYQLLGCRIGTRPNKLFSDPSGKSWIDFSVYIKSEDIKNE